jgi:Flp pilus assembly protein TadD
VTPKHAARVRTLNAQAAQAFASKQYARAGELFSQVVSIDPSDVAARYNLGRVEELLGRFDRAALAYRGAIERDASYAPAHARLGIVLSQLRDYDAAAAALRRAIELRPDDDQAAFNLGVVEDQHGRACVTAEDYGRAEELFRSAARRLPQAADPLANLAFLYHVLGRVDEAIAAGECAIAIDPGHAQSHVNLALSCLLAGDYARGLAEYEWRHIEPRFRLLPRWDGSDLGGARLLVSREQGLGDFILLSRFFRDLRARGARVCVEVPAPLRELYHAFDGIDEMLDEPAADDPSAYAAYLPIASIPYVLRLDPAAIPAPVPYLHADVERTRRFAERYRARAKRRSVGIVWAGSAAHAMDRHRSCPLHAFDALAGIDGIAWVSLQKGAPLAQAERNPDPLDLLRADESLETLADTAAAIAALDVIVCVDTSIAHLAGALGRPVWLLNGFGNYWLWGLHASGTPWYPTMRLFHQPRPGDWSGLFGNVRRALESE